MDQKAEWHLILCLIRLSIRIPEIRRYGGDHE